MEMLISLLMLCYTSQLSSSDIFTIQTSSHLPLGKKVKKPVTQYDELFCKSAAITAVTPLVSCFLSDCGTWLQRMLNGGEVRSGQSGSSTPENRENNVFIELPLCSGALSC